MQPFTPVGKTNMIAWLAARSDEPNYGKLVVYKYPKERLVFGPLQVEGRIDQDPTISSQFTLWSQAGSRVIRGNMLVIPIGDSNLYVEPIYLQAENGPIPELKRVVVSTGNRVVMEPTLEEALTKLFGVADADAARPAPGRPVAQAQPSRGTRPGGIHHPAASPCTPRRGGADPLRQPPLRARPGRPARGRLGPLRRGAAALEADLQRLSELSR